MMTESVASPEGWAAIRGSTARTIPDVGAWTAAEIH